jgi:alpha-galactosidase
MRRRTRRGLISALLVAGVGLAGAVPALAEDNGVGQRPALGWSSWSFVRKHPTAAIMEAQARAMKSSGLAAVGYQYANLDDFWYVCPAPGATGAADLRSTGMAGG